MTGQLSIPSTLKEVEISAIVCTYNRDRYIEKSLESLAEQTLPKNLYEIIIIDNRSTDNTAILCQQFIERHSNLNIRYIFENNKGLSYARNRGWQEAASPIITYIDDDAEAIPGFLQAITEFMHSHKDAVGIGGRVIPKYAHGKEPGWMNPYLNGFVGKVEFGNEPSVFAGKMKYPAGCNMTYKRAVLEQVGGFNNELTFRSDDKYIYYQVARISEKVYYLPSATIYHNIDESRLQFDSFRKLFMKTGNEEKIRIKLEEGNIGLLKRFFEYIFKVTASAILFIRYLIMGQITKGKFIVFSQWFTLKGFLKKEVFFR